MWMLGLPVVLLIGSVMVSLAMVKRGVGVRKTMKVHLLTVCAVVALMCVLPMMAAADNPADAADTTTIGATEAETTETAATEAGNGLKYIGAALSVGIGAIGGGIAVAAGAPAAIGATAEDPKSFGKSIIFVALGEGFGLYGLLIAILCLVM